MLEFFTYIVFQFGLFGLFITAFFSSTIFFPIPTEPVLLTVAPFFNPFLVVFVASVGSLFGTCINYALGYFLGMRWIRKRVSDTHWKKAKQFSNKYSWPGLFFVLALPIPAFPVDPITIIPGITRMNFLHFTIVVFLGKVIKYSIFVGLFNGLIELLRIGII